LKRSRIVASERIVIVGGPRCGKSWLANELSPKIADDGSLVAPIYCGDPLSTVKDPCMYVNYLPNGLPYAGDDGAAAWVAEHWLSMRGPWILEGHVMARALRRWMHASDAVEEYPCDRIIVFEDQRHDCDLKRGQVAMHKGVMRVWAGIRNYFDPITEYR
jgi:hypothetical protein